MSSNAVGRPMEILLVEDSITQARLTIQALRESNSKHRLTLVRDGREAIEFLFRQGTFSRAPRPDLILLNLRLPKVDGLDVLGAIKGDAELKEIPVVIMTASDDEEDRVRCESLEVEAYVTKPVNFDKFLAIVQELKKYWHEDVIVPTP